MGLSDDKYNMNDFEKLIKDNEYTINYLSQKYFLPSHTVDDIRQIILITIWEKFRLYDKAIASFPTFISTIVKREFSNRIVKSQAQKRTPPGNKILSLDATLQQDDFRNLHQMISSPQSPINYKEELEELLPILSVREKKVLLLRLRNYKYSEIQQILPLTKKQVQRTLYRIKQKAKFKRSISMQK